MSIDHRKEEVEKKLEEFKMAKLVVTDRLHGMIFAAITGTNCIVLNSRSRKLKGCYEWIRSLGYIRCADDVEDILIQYSQMPAYPHTYDDQAIIGMMDQLKCDLQELLNLQDS